MTEQSNPLSRADVEQAYQRIKDLVKRTPVFTSSLLNQEIGVELFFKGEHLQSS